MWDCFHLQADKIHIWSFLILLSLGTLFLLLFIIQTRTSAFLGFNRTSWTHLFYQFLLKLWDYKEKCTNPGRRTDTNSYAAICVSYLVRWLFSTSHFKPHHPCFLNLHSCVNAILCASVCVSVCVRERRSSVKAELWCIILCWWKKKKKRMKHEPIKAPGLIY